MSDEKQFTTIIEDGDTKHTVISSGYTYESLRNISPEPTESSCSSDQKYRWHGSDYTRKELIELACEKKYNPWPLRGFSGVRGQEGWDSIRDRIRIIYGTSWPKVCWIWVQEGCLIIVNKKLKMIGCHMVDIRDVKPIYKLIIILKEYGLMKQCINKEYWEVFGLINENKRLHNRYDKNGFLVKTYIFGYLF